jgi:hypothetical protein
VNGGTLQPPGLDRARKREANQVAPRSGGIRPEITERLPTIERRCLFMCSIFGIQSKSIDLSVLKECFDRTISRGPDMSRFVEIPYGPYICLGCLAWMFFGPRLVSAYLSLFTP